MSNAWSQHQSHTSHPTKAEEKAEAKEAKEAKAAAASGPRPVETISPEVKLDKEGKPEKEAKAEKPKKLGAIDTNRLLEELRGVVNEPSTTPNNPAARLVFAELANAIERSFEAKPEPAKEEKKDKDDE